MTPSEAHVFFDFTKRTWPEGSVFRYFARRPVDGAIYAETLDDAAGLVRVTEWADRHGYNSYWMPNPTSVRGRIRPRTADISHWQWLLVDIDPVAPDGNPGGCARRVHALLGDHFESVPTPLRVDSGRGQQSLYPIEPHDLNEGWIERTDMTRITSTGAEFPEVVVVGINGRTFAPQVASWWLHTLRKQLGPGGTYEGCTIDTSCSDLPRAMRIPYTRNAKSGRRADVIGYPSGSVFTAEDLAKPVPMVKPDSVTQIEAKRWTDFVPKMTVGGRRFLLEGAEEPGRHRAAASAMLSMLDLGATKQHVLSALLYGAKRCTPELDPKEIFDMVERRFR